MATRVLPCTFPRFNQILFFITHLTRCITQEQVVPGRMEVNIDEPLSLRVIQTYREAEFASRSTNSAQIKLLIWKTC